MTTYKLYRDIETGDIVINPDDAPTCELVELESDDECYLTDREFRGWWGDAETGGAYQAEWACLATDNNGERYEIVWRFDETKGSEREAEDLPWDSAEHIHAVWAH